MTIWARALPNHSWSVRPMNHQPAESTRTETRLYLVFILLPTKLVPSRNSLTLSFQGHYGSFFLKTQNNSKAYQFGRRASNMLIKASFENWRHKYFASRLPMATFLYFVRMREIKAWELIHGTGIYAHGLETPSVPRLFFLFNFFQFFKNFFLVFSNCTSCLSPWRTYVRGQDNQATSYQHRHRYNKNFQPFFPKVLLYNEG